MANRMLTVEEAGKHLKKAVLAECLEMQPGKTRTFQVGDCLPLVVTAPTDPDKYANWKTECERGLRS